MSAIVDTEDRAFKGNRESVEIGYHPMLAIFSLLAIYVIDSLQQDYLISRHVSVMVALGIRLRFDPT